MFIVCTERIEPHFKYFSEFFSEILEFSLEFFGIYLELF